MLRSSSKILYSDTIHDVNDIIRLLIEEYNNFNYDLTVDNTTFINMS